MNTVELVISKTKVQLVLRQHAWVTVLDTIIAEYSINGWQDGIRFCQRWFGGLPYQIIP